MRVGGRARCAGAGLLPQLLTLCLSVNIVASNEYGVPIEIKLWDSGRTPLAHMVDITNGFGLKVLAEHNFLNENNIAFSPYGLMGILVALYEGVDGEASFQLQSSMDLPWSRNVMRVGFRDIHRTLKTYFVPEEGFLAGLALNNENVTFNESYKRILRFYGFDLDNNGQIPTLPPTNGTNATTTMPEPAETTTTTAPTSASATPDMISTQAREDPTTNPNAETLSDLDLRGPTTTVSPSLAPNAESTTMMTTTQSTAPRSTMQDTTTPSTTVPNTETSPTTTPAMTTVTSTTTTAPTTVETTTTSSTTVLIFTELIPPQTSSAFTIATEPTVNNEVEDTTSDMSSSTSTDESTTENGAGTQTTENTESTTSISETESEMTDSTVASSPSTIETLQRRKKSIVDFLYTNPPYFGDDYLLYRSYDVPVIIPEQVTPNSLVDNQMFLVNGLRNVQVTYMHYDSILDHAYLPHLEASALRLPLDSDRYYLLVVLPSRGGEAELGRLLARMARESDLSDVCAALRPRHVRAIVPSFTVKGHVTLTTDLQKLGIRDVFEPRQRDFTPMTSQPGVYVRSIEQAVSVAIRKYRATDQANASRYISTRNPVSFSATYPFLYFVMDSNIHVSLMAGKLVDPLNSRIL